MEDEICYLPIVNYQENIYTIFILNTRKGEFT
jgi:hypothetical protein